MDLRPILAALAGTLLTQSPASAEVLADGHGILWAGWNTES